MTHSNAAVSAVMPLWANAEHRIDPRALDVRRTFEVSGRRFGLDARGATMEREDGVTVPLRPASFEGVTARAMEDDEGRVTVTLELMHSDPSLSVPLLVAADLDDVAADWRDWARLFSLPMLMVEADGSVEMIDDGSVIKDAPSPRRPRASKRPRFLMRRRTGALGVGLRIEGREIIARR